MVEGLIGKKIGITQSFDEEGNVSPVTVIQVGPCTVFQIKSEKKDGYSSLQLGLVEERGRKKPTKALAGHCEKAGVHPPRILREFRYNEQAQIKVGDQFFVDLFEKGEKVHITGRSKGKGFAGVVKRWGHHGGKDTHGSMFHRAPGSIGASAYPSRVVKGKKLPGHLGDSRVTVRNLEVIQVEKENNLLVVKGPIPGADGGYLMIKKAHFEPTAVPPKPKPSEDKKTEEIEAEDKKVEGKKVEADTERAESKKAEGKKPEEKKVEAKKTEDKKTEDSKVEAKKHADKKTEDK